MRKWAGAEDGPNEKYRDAFVWYDGDNKDNFTAYKLPIADVIDGELTIKLPRAVASAAGGGRCAWRSRRTRRRDGSHQGPPGQVLQKMGDTPPWKDD